MTRTEKKVKREKGPVAVVVGARAVTGQSRAKTSKNQADDAYSRLSSRNHSGEWWTGTKSDVLDPRALDQGYPKATCMHTTKLGHGEEREEEETGEAKMGMGCV